MAQNLTEHIRDNPCQGFRSRPHYFREGDYVTYFITDERCVAERVDELLTVYHSMADRARLVGCKIKGVRRLLEEGGDFGVTVEDGPIKLGLLFLVGSKLKDEPAIRKRYREVSRITKDAEIDPKEFQLA